MPYLLFFAFRFWATKTLCPKCGHTWTDRAKMSDMLFNLTKVNFFWINRDQQSFEWFVQLLSALELEQACICRKPSKQSYNIFFSIFSRKVLGWKITLHLLCMPPANFIV